MPNIISKVIKASLNNYRGNFFFSKCYSVNSQEHGWIWCRLLIINFLFFLSSGANFLSPLRAQPIWEASSIRDSVRAQVVGYTTVGASAATLGVLGTAWYGDEGFTSFRVFDDSKEWLFMDKAGHLTTAYQVSRLVHGAWLWTGVSERISRRNAAITALGFLTAIEIFDGFSPDYGFSWYDAAANLGGTALFLGQQQLWNEQRIALKFSFHRSPFPQYRPELLGASPIEQILKDYNGQTYWLSVTPASFMRESKIPRWLALSIGYGASGMVSAANSPPPDYSGPLFSRYRQVYLSLDVDLTKLRLRPGPLKTVLSAFGFLKVPFPALVYNGYSGEITLHPFYF